MNEQEKKPSNPSAFPEPYVNDPSSAISHTKGMTLRDYFANSAMQALVTNEAEIQRAKLKSPDVNSVIASISYALADAMLKQREL